MYNSFAVKLRFPYNSCIVICAVRIVICAVRNVICAVRNVICAVRKNFTTRILTRTARAARARRVFAAH
eukprot:UN10065